jgi:hypothetical protein
MKRAALVGLALIAFVLTVSAQPKYGVTVVADKGTDFKKLKTYVWKSGWDASERKAHEAIVAAIDREMKGLGFELKASGPSDVILKYGAMRRIDVEISTLGSQLDKPRNQIDVGSLIVLMLDPATSKELLRMRLDRPIEIAPDKMEATIGAGVTEIFAHYPTRVVKK